jgi:prepilin-type N-terminal cleavage/methylation domain-containing protein
MKFKIDRRGITLIELICVMVVLSGVMAISVPVLSRFFSGRSLEEESRRFLALTRYARSEAVSRSALLELWIEPDLGSYGLSRQAVNAADDSSVQYHENSAREYQLAEGLEFEVDSQNLDDEGRAKILFWPDGAIDEESLDELTIREDEKNSIDIKRAEFGMGYEIKEEEESD